MKKSKTRFEMGYQEDSRIKLDMNNGEIEEDARDCPILAKMKEKDRVG